MDALHKASRRRLSAQTLIPVDEHHITTPINRRKSTGFKDSIYRLVNNKAVDDTNSKPRILALHGKQSNNAITKLQLENLSITSDNYEIIYLQGPIHSGVADPEIEELVDGPFYSWFYGGNIDTRFRHSLLKAVGLVWKFIERSGSFDAIYGFSQGSTVAALVASSYCDLQFRNLLLQAIEEDHRDGSYVHAESHPRETFAIGKQNSNDAISVAASTSMAGTASLATSIFFTLNSSSPTSRISPELFNKPPFNYMIMTCCVDKPNILGQALDFPDFANNLRILIPSIHLIGTLDPRKQNSEEMTSIFSDVQVKYMAGTGHAVSRTVQQDMSFIRMINGCINSCQNYTQSQQHELEMKVVAPTSQIGVMQQYQMVHVKLENLIPNPTIINLLQQTDPEKALFYCARETNSSTHSTYGDILEFIENGPGDLRRLGVTKDQVVAYGAPPGGGAVAALIFLSIMSQTTAAPLASNTSESDALDLLEQFGASHLILFDNINYADGIVSAFSKFAATGKAILHRAKIRSSGSKPGMFDYTYSGFSRLDPSTTPQYVISPLRNPIDGVALLLGTSGTTSRPKGVPIIHGSIIQNAYILANNIGLRETDVCYSVMPLFHIGGIVASILCTIASSGSICCENAEVFTPESMVQALAISNPQPTWYSAVPTIHNATVAYLKDMGSNSSALKAFGVIDGIWKQGHSLRLIRSGAAALLGPDALALSSTYGNVPVYPTYSMSEQMPISQPPSNMTNTTVDKPGSVGVPISANLAIVNSSNLNIQPHGKEGEIAICGSTMMENYLHNVEADKKAFFILTVPGVSPGNPLQRGRYFLTGDVGFIDRHGFLTLKGRSKELIKKGGEQVSPFEIEEPLIDHPWIEVALCFSVPSKLYGEEVGLALVLSSFAPMKVSTEEVVKEMRKFLNNRDINPLKWPTKWRVVSDDDLPKTKSKKYIRVGLAKVLGIDDDVKNTGPGDDPLKPKTKKNNTFIDWGAISGFRFILACYVMLMHIGSEESWGSFANMRKWPWHVHVFFSLGGFSLVAPMNPVIPKKFKYFTARLLAMYPMYTVALIFVFVNTLVTCRPSTFRPEFHWNAQPDDLYIEGKEENGVGPFFCEGTPLTPKSYWISMLLSLSIFLFGVAVTPMWMFTWWIGYYFWFSAMYYQCLMIFPSMYNKLFEWRGNTSRFILSIFVLLYTDYVIQIVTWFSLRHGESYYFYDPVTGEKNINEENFHDASFINKVILSWYLLSPLWVLYFIIGACTAFLYDAYRPAERGNKHIWGHISDFCSLIMAIWTISLIRQGASRKYLHPREADDYTDTAAVARLWSNICGRLAAPITTLWIFALSTGEGFTASLLRSPTLSQTFAPHAYNCFLFHQPVGQWYFAITRGKGHWWSYWQYRKDMYWFSPKACPVEWYEYFSIVLFTVGFSSLMNCTAEPFLSALIQAARTVICGEDDNKDVNIEKTLLDAIEDMTGLNPLLEWTLEQCGLSSLGLPQLATRVNSVFSSKNNPISITAAQLSNARTVGDIVHTLREIIDQADSSGI